MKGRKIGKKIIALVLAVIMTVPSSAWGVLAANVGDRVEVETGVMAGSLNTSDTIQLPIKIYDYLGDGMLFEFAESYSSLPVTGDVRSEKLKFQSSLIYQMDEDGGLTITDADGNIATEDDGTTPRLLLKSYGDSTTHTFYDVETDSVDNTFVRVEKGTSEVSSDDAAWTGGNPTIKLEYVMGPNVSMDDRRYMVMVYRTDITSGDMYVSINRFYDKDGDGVVDTGANTPGNYTQEPFKFTQAGSDKTAEGKGWVWTYAIYDLKAFGEDTWDIESVWDCSLFIGLPITDGKSVDISRVAFFSDEERAESYGEYMASEGGDRGNNKGFGLLRGSYDKSGSVVFHPVYEHEGSSSATANTVTDMSTITNLGYTLLGDFTAGVATFGLLESAIGPNGYPVYKKAVVDYLAALLQYSLEIPERDGMWRNYRYVKGEPSERYGGVDFATALRTRINGNMGTYENASQNNLVGTWEDVNENITSYYDAAYFMLNSIFVPGSYNEPQSTYDYLLLSAATAKDANGEEAGKTYVFDAGFTYLKTEGDESSRTSAVFYDTANKTISNISADGKTHFYYNANYTTTLFPFLPITDKNNAEGGTKSENYQDDGVYGTAQMQDTYANRDYNYVLVSEGEFAYYESENLFFEFEGDDDVYLFINDELVLDIGGAHGIDGYKVDINSYVEAAKARTLGDDTTDAGKARNNKLSLEEGETYSFKFYYMERHGTGANMRINTNIKVTDPNMITVKNAYQNGDLINYGEAIDKNGIIEYEFVITNNGGEKLYNFSFRDEAIGVNINPTDGLLVTGSNVSDLNGGTLEASDLQVILTHPDPKYQDVYINFNNNEELKLFLVSVNNNAALESGAGLWQQSTLRIRGIGYTLTSEQKDAGLFDNIVFTGATNKAGDKVIYGQDNTRVMTDEALVYYQWANHEIQITPSKLIQDIANRIENLTSDKVASVVLTDENGNPVVNTDEVQIDANGNLVLKYKTTGSKMFYAQAKHVLLDTSELDEYNLYKGFGATKDASGNMSFKNAQGYVFTIDGRHLSVNETTTIVDVISNYSKCNPNWAVSVQLRPTSDGKYYEVIKVVQNPGAVTSAEEAGFTTQADDIIMITHSASSNPNDGYKNWKSKVAALALKEGDIVQVAKNNDNYTSVTVLGGTTVRAIVNVTDVKDSVFVLDYGLAVELLSNGALFANDTAYAPGYSTIAQVIAMGVTEPSYSPNANKLNNIDFTPAGTTLKGENFDGEYVFDQVNQTLKYVPLTTMDGTDSIYIAVSVRESDYTGALVLGNVNINKEVQMYKSISVLPANVVYYEDDSPAIHYNTENTKNVFTQIGGSEDLTQSADQDQAYGQDDVYKDNANADMSGNSITQITVNQAGVVAYFDFTGTGFELISRTNAFDAALFTVKVVEVTTNASGEETETQIKNLAVIPEFDQNGDGGKEEIYQVPLMRVNDLAYGKYRVYITGVPTYSFATGTPVAKETILYIDGIRIFQPLGASNNNYLSSENGAQFAEIRNLILSGKAAVAGYSADGTTISTGTVSWTENRNDIDHESVYFEGNRVQSANDYLMLGPNNEVYMDGDYEGASALVFYVNEVGSGAHNLQIALHAVDKGTFYGTYAMGMEGFVVYGALAKKTSQFAWKPLVNLYSATEQYYTIDYKQCPYIPERGYQVVLLVESGMVSYTSLKYTGLELGNMSGGEGDLPTIEYENGILKDIETGEELEKAEFPELFSLRRLLATQSIFSDENTVGDNIIIGDVEFGDSTEGDDDEADNPEEDDTGAVKDKIKYQTRNESDIRLIAYVDDLTAYSGVSFTLTIDGKESQELVCTTAYAGLNANGKIKTTKEIYGEDGYFVVYTINRYLEVFAGQEVTIKVTYTTVTGETITQSRTTIFE